MIVRTLLKNSRLGSLLITKLLSLLELKLRIRVGIDKLTNTVE